MEPAVPETELCASVRTLLHRLATASAALVVVVVVVVVMVVVVGGVMTIRMMGMVKRERATGSAALVEIVAIQQESYTKK